MSFHATDAGFSARTIRLSTFRKHLMSSVCAGLIIVAAGSGALAQQVPGKYFNADGSKTNDYEAAKKSWLDDKEFNGNWGLKALNADAAYAQGINGTGSKVGVIDQPVWAAHREFAGADKLKFITTQGIRTYTDPYLPVKAGEPFIYDGRIYIDGDKGIAHHGTHVAGIAAGNRNGSVATSVNRVVSDSDHENFRPAVFGMQGGASGAKIFARDTG
ncbi:MAG: S8 family serine peptidase, partial [Pyrinomonadaceae bacterium]